jgi:membrane associated rhomboid family serine protease
VARVLLGIVSVLAGYVALGVVKLLFSLAMIAAFPADLVDAAGQPRYVGDWWFLLDLAYTFVAATVGALVTWRLAPRAPLPYLGALAALIALMSVVTIVGSPDGPPAWWTLGELLVALVAVFGVASWQREPEPA